MPVAVAHDWSNRLLRRQSPRAALGKLGQRPARHLVTSDHHRLSARVDSLEGTHQTGEIDVDGIVQRIGTGDAFAAGLLHGWLVGGDLQAMADTGLALAALKHSIPGNLCLIGPGELDAFSASGGDVRR